MSGAAIYLRLSREDGEGESQSIANQRSILNQYMKSHGIEPGMEFVDDGYSGLSFERPAFQKMCGAIERGEINLVLTKDLSRLGRDYIQTGYYLERYFPEKEVRYIAVTDGIDTAAGQDDLTPFRAVMNDLYAKDISKKVRAALDAKKQKGEFIGARAPYGYRRKQENHNRLEKEMCEAETVKKMFEAAIKGETAEEIARELNEKRISSPSGRAAWSGTMVRRIITNPTYCGKLTQNRARKMSYKIARKKNLPPEEWVIVPQTHEPVVTEAEWKAAGKLMGKGKGSQVKWECGGCGKTMKIKKNARGLHVTCRGKSACGRERFFGKEDILALHQAAAARLEAEGISKEVLGQKGAISVLLEKIIVGGDQDVTLVWYFDFHDGRGADGGGRTEAGKKDV